MVVGTAPRSGRRARLEEARVAELRELCRTAGVAVVDVVAAARGPSPIPSTWSAAASSRRSCVRAMQLDAEALIFDPDLTPGQARAIADATDLKVIDRTS